MKKLNVNKEKFNKIMKGIKLILVIAMLILIYMVSPKITNIIQNIALYLYEIESTYITRVVELILTVSILLTIFTSKKEVK